MRFCVRFAEIRIQGHNLVCKVFCQNSDFRFHVCVRHALVECGVGGVWGGGVGGGVTLHEIAASCDLNQIRSTVARAPKIRIQIRRWLTTLPQLHRFRGSDSKETPATPLRNSPNPDFRFQIPNSKFRVSNVSESRFQSSGGAPPRNPQKSGFRLQSRHSALAQLRCAEIRYQCRKGTQTA